VEADHLGSLVALLNDHGLVHLECAPPTLEQLFMSHYEGEDS